MAQNMQASSNSPSNSMIDSYRQYKNDTNSFLTWLANVGVRCGFRLSPSDHTTNQPPNPPPQKTAPRLKGKERKLAKEAEKKVSNPAQSNLSIVSKTLPIRDFVPLAKQIASAKSPVTVPQSVLRKLERAITLRNQCASWFETTAQDAASLASNDAHKHFITVLETVLETLEPLCNRTSDLEKEKDATSNKDHSSHSNNPHDIHNRFAALALYAAEEEEEEFDFQPQQNVRGKKDKASSTQKNTFTPEQQPQKDEFMLACFCFFRDLQDVRVHLQELWRRYKEGQITLITATLITTTATDFVRRMEENLMQTFAQSGDYYDCFVDQMFRQACLARGQPFIAKRDPDAFPSDFHETQPYVDEMIEEAELIMLPMWHLLKYCARPYHSDADRTEVMLKRDKPYPQGPQTQIWQDHTLGANVTEAKDQRLFNSRLFDLITLSFSFQTESKGADNFRNGWQTMVKTKMVPTWLVFAAQNLLDIHHILKVDICRAVKELQLTCAISLHNVRRHIRFLEELEPKTVADTFDFESLKKYRDKVILADEYPYFGIYFALDPLGAGARQFFTVAWLRKTGVESDNSSDIVAMAQLYQAAKTQSNCIDWADMEFIVTTQTPEHIFFGGRPTTFEQCCLKTELAMGRSIRNVLPTSPGPDASIMSGKGYRYLRCDDLPFTTIFRARGFAALPQDTDKAAEALELFVTSILQGVDQSKLRQDTLGNLVSKVDLLKLTSRKPKATIFQILTVLEENLVQEEPALHFDFCRFRLLCMVLLRAVQEKIDSTWAHAAGIARCPDLAKVPTTMVPFAIMATAKFSKAQERMVGVPHFGSRTLNEVTEVLESFIHTTGGDGVEALQKEAGSIVAARFLAEFGNLSQERSGALVPRPTLTSLTEEEIHRSRAVGQFLGGEAP